MKRKLLLTVIASSLVVSGCSWLNPGEEEFACSGMPGSVFCHSARDVYQKTNSGVVPSPIRGNTYNKNCKDCVRSEDENPELLDGENGNAVALRGTQTVQGGNGKTLDVTDDEIINNYVSPNLPTRPVPVRTPAQIMRIWVGPYVDSNGDLVAPGIVYTEIEPRKWIYPSTENGYGALNNRILRPLSERSEYSGGTSPNDYNNNAGQKAVDQGEFSALQRFGKEQQTLKRRVTN